MVLVIAPREDAGSLSFSDFGLEAELLERKNDFLFDLGEETIPSGVLERGEDLLPNSLLLFIGFFISMPSSISIIEIHNMGGFLCDWLVFNAINSIQF